MLNKVRVRNIDNDVEKLLKARFMHKSDENCPKDAFHIYTKNQTAMKRNHTVLNNLPDEPYAIEIGDKITENFLCHLVKLLRIKSKQTQET